MRIVITGANRGIGAGLYQTYCTRGEEVIGTARNPAPDSELRPLDVTSPASVKDFAAGLGEGPVGLLICNAGIYPDKGMALDDGYPAEIWAQSFATNTTGVFLTVQALLPNLRAAGSGRIAILSSIMASDARAPGGSYAYRASKAAVLNLGRNLATDLAADGIAVGIYHPGWVRTEMGGPGADIDTGAAVAGLLTRFDALDLSHSGSFQNYDGTPIPF